MADIELVIKIPQKAYNALTHAEFDANLVVNEMSKAIANGTPLPKGHGEQEPVLDKIKDKIEKERTFQRVMGEYDIATGLRKALEIIDKYKAESEEV